MQLQHKWVMKHQKKKENGNLNTQFCILLQYKRWSYLNHKISFNLSAQVAIYLVFHIPIMMLFHILRSVLDHELILDNFLIPSSENDFWFMKCKKASFAQVPNTHKFEKRECWSTHCIHTTRDPDVCMRYVQINNCENKKIKCAEENITRLYVCNLKQEPG